MMFNKAGLHVLGLLSFFFCHVLLNAVVTESHRRSVAPISRSIVFKRLTLDDGLSQSSIQCIAQDVEGFIWFGTANGLNRYDGNQIRVYKKDKGDEHSISSNSVVFLLLDLRGRLWCMGGDGVLNRYDRDIDGFHRVSSGIGIQPNRVGNLVSLVDGQGMFWFGANPGGLWRFDPISGAHISFSSRLDPAETMRSKAKRIRVLELGQDGCIWIGTMEGLFRYFPEEDRLVRYPFHPLGTSGRPGDQQTGSPYISSVLEGRNGNVWIGTDFGGLQKLDRQSHRFVHFPFGSKAPDALPESSALLLLEDHLGMLWISSRPYNPDGSYRLPTLVRLDPETGEFTRFRHDENNPCSISQNNALRIFEDERKRIWMHTFGGGIDIFEYGENCFTHFGNRSEDPTSLSDNAISSVFVDRSGIIWLGTATNGVSYFDPNWKKFPHIPIEAQAEFRDNNQMVFAILGSDVPDAVTGRKNVIWISTQAGLNRWNRLTNQFDFFEFSPNVPDNIAFSLCEDKRGRLWLGTAQGLYRSDAAVAATASSLRFECIGPKDSSKPVAITSLIADSRDQLWLVSRNRGLCRVDPLSGELVCLNDSAAFSQSLSALSLRLVFPGRNGWLWLSSVGGLSRLDPERGTVQPFFTPSPEGISGYVSAMYEDGEGVLWLAWSEEGMQRFDPRSGQSDFFGLAEGLCDNNIHAILPEFGEESGQLLWISTDNGLCRFDRKSGLAKRFDRSDGLQSNEFNAGAYWQAEDGELFFGGVNGLTVFYPEQIRLGRYQPPVYITDFRILNNSVAHGPDSILQKPIEFTSGIDLSYREKIISFEFNALDYSAPEKIRYACYLEGFEESWNDIGNRRFVSYTNLPAGTYTFHVKASNSDGIWSEHMARLKLKVHPAPWLTWWAFTVYGLVLIGALITVHRWRTAYLRDQQVRLAREVRERTQDLTIARDEAEAANRAKSVFLANMSHELRTPLNAVLGFTQLMIRENERSTRAQLDESQLENLHTIARSGRHLLALINDVLEMSKIEAGRIALEKEVIDLRQLVVGLEDMFRLRAQAKALPFEIRIDDDVPVLFVSDRKKLVQVLLNLVGNALKFTRSGSVELRVQRRPGTKADEKPDLIFEVEDTGPGMAKKDLEAVFEPFIQTQLGRRHEGTGLGLSISRHFVRLLGGELSVKSVEGKGSCFRFDIPVETVDEASRVEINPPAHVTAIESLGSIGDGPLRVLAVDDVPAGRRLLSKLLTPLGMEVREAADGKQAVEIWEAWKPHLIFMDMRMPVMDGRRASREIRAREQGERVVIVALTASSFEEERGDIMASGCDDMIRKPFTEEELFSVFERYLGVRFVTRPKAESGAEGRKRMEADSHLASELHRELTGALVSFPEDLRGRLRQAVRDLDLGRTEAVLSELDSSQEWASAKLSHIASDFRFDILMDLLDSVEPKNGH